MITQFIYTSSALCDLTSERGRIHVADIIACAERNNPRFGITGFLLVGRNWFAQVLEGETIAVSNLFRCLLKDLRHVDIRLVETRLARQRSLADWAMGHSQEEISNLSLDQLLTQTDATHVLDQPFDRILRLAEARASAMSPPASR